jgi:hypothetical protein
MPKIEEGVYRVTFNSISVIVNTAEVIPHEGIELQTV